MLWRKECDELEVGRFAQNIDRLAAAAVASRVVGHQTYAHAGELFEAVALQHIDAGEDLRLRDCLAICVCRPRI